MLQDKNLYGHVMPSNLKYVPSGVSVFLHCIQVLFQRKTEVLSFCYFLSGPLNGCGLICHGDVSFVR